LVAVSASLGRLLQSQPKIAELKTQIERLDIPGKLTGEFTYIQDFRVPGMLHGRVVRPPAIGARLESVDESSIENVPGIVKIVRDGDFLGVVALSEWSAVRAAREIVTTWSKSETLPDQGKLWEQSNDQDFEG
jgi:xanthine dehydrogenase molybdopterin-binding subunit B